CAREAGRAATGSNRFDVW
nr:immunoglobulin heavy chain junction region [Macaca mulatta]MOW32197.1 immunoglobulin heavy chain junction region [Macaca mulatta]MOW32200.1 immunoglobulin heavy chain junction region [Macaca mulatta]MOW32445.1 immunoglobulin heavy chain junction region [Macaca mulatta]MOW32485.1 immunoglobulin heavy chain junction region [Macaca mulatta]